MTTGGTAVRMPKNAVKVSRKRARPLSAGDIAILRHKAMRETALADEKRRAAIARAAERDRAALKG